MFIDCLCPVQLSGLPIILPGITPFWGWVVAVLASFIVLLLIMGLFYLLLKQKVAVQTRELKAATEKAVAADRLKTLFLANMSHEIRSPLNAIVGFSRLLSDTDTDPERRKSYVEIINANSRQLLYLISDILDFSRIESGEVELYFQMVSVREMIEELYHNFERYRDQIGRNHLDFRIECPEEDVQICTDPVRLKQIMTNLLNNAFKFTEQGQISLCFEKPYKDSRGRQMIRFEVRDTGIGIPAEKLDEIFDRFRQVDEGYSRKFSGAGLGLTLSRRLVELLDGEIRVESRRGEGSLFTVVFPVHREKGEK